MNIVQVLPSLASRDAIGVHTLNLDAALRSVGIETAIYYGNAGNDVADRGLPLTQLDRSDAHRIILYHASIGSPVVGTLETSAGILALNYHNITPARLLARWAPGLGYEVSLGRAQLSDLAGRTRFALADSEFNRRELVDLGYRTTETAPLLLNMRQADASCDDALLTALKSIPDQGPRFLFVGKVAPHKAPHDLLAMLAAYRATYHPGATLTLVGTPISERYLQALESYMEDLGLSQAVTITGSISGASLEAYWRSSDVFICASDHAGFCVPLVEAMGHELPIVAFAAAAIPETIADAGLVISDKAPLAFAAAVHRVVTDHDLAKALTNRGKDRVSSLDLETATGIFMERLIRNAETALSA